MDRATEHFGSGTPRTEGDEWASTIARTVVVLGPRPLPRELSRLLLHSRRLPLALGLLPLGSSFPRQAVVTADHTRSFLRLALDAFDAYAGTAPPPACESSSFGTETYVAIHTLKALPEARSDKHRCQSRDRRRWLRGPIDVTRQDDSHA